VGTSGSLIVSRSIRLVLKEISECMVYGSNLCSSFLSSSFTMAGLNRER
jgi:hypothetical protein